MNAMKKIFFEQFSTEKKQSALADRSPKNHKKTGTLHKKERRGTKVQKKSERKMAPRCVARPAAPYLSSKLHSFSKKRRRGENLTVQ